MHSIFFNYFTGERSNIADKSLLLPNYDFNFPQWKVFVAHPQQSTPHPSTWHPPSSHPFIQHDHPIIPHLLPNTQHIPNKRCTRASLSPLITKRPGSWGVCDSVVLPCRKGNPWTRFALKWRRLRNVVMFLVQSLSQILVLVSLRGANSTCQEWSLLITFTSLRGPLTMLRTRNCRTTWIRMVLTIDSHWK